MTNFIPDYDDATVDEVVDQLDDLDPEQLRELYDYESAHKHRVTLLDAIDQELDSRDGVEVTADEPDDPTDDEDGDDETESTEDEADERGQVRVRVPGRGYYAGHWFDEGQYVTLDHTNRVQDAIDDGDLTLIDDTPDQ